MRTCHTAGRFDSGPSQNAERRQGPAEGKPPEGRDGFRIVRLVMSINFLHIQPSKR